MDVITAYLKNLVGKLFLLLQSRKFWALVTALVVIFQQLSLGQIDGWQATIAAVTALSVYAAGTAVEDGLKALGTKSG